MHLHTNHSHAGHQADNEPRIGGDRLLTVEHISKALSIPRQQIYKMVRSGRLPHLKLGRSVRFSERELLELLRERSRSVERELLEPALQ
jgi:excisionase family DNA binding protein